MSYKNVILGNELLNNKVVCKKGEAYCYAIIPKAKNDGKTLCEYQLGLVFTKIMLKNIQSLIG